MALTVKRQRGVVVEYGGSGLTFDASSKKTDYPVFVTHAHADHAAAFKYPELTKYATEPTFRLLENLRWRKLGNWNPVSVGSTIKIDDIEVKVHNAGHVLGSVQYEVNTPEGSILYTGDFGMGNSYTMDAAKTMSCDILVIETTFGAPMFMFEPSDLTKPDMVLQIGVAPLRIDIITSIVGVDFETAWKNRVTVKHEGLEVPVIGIDELIQNKLASGREEDKLDAKKLEKLRSSRNP